MFKINYNKKSNFINILILALLFFLSGYVQFTSAQTVSIKGKITDKKSSLPVQAAAVFISYNLLN